MSDKEKKTTEATEKAASPQKTMAGTDEKTASPEKKMPEAKSANATKQKKPTDNNVLKSVGIAACKRYKLTVVWVASDGQAFPNENDAKNHARNLANNELLKVTT